MAGAARAAEANAAAPAPASISRRFSGKKRSAAKQLLHQILPDRLAQLRRRAAENAARGFGNVVGCPAGVGSIGPTYRLAAWSVGKSVKRRQPLTTHATLSDSSKCGAMRLELPIQMRGSPPRCSMAGSAFNKAKRGRISAVGVEPM